MYSHCCTNDREMELLANRVETMHHVIVQSCGMKGLQMESIKIVGKSGQISLGKSLAGRGFVLQVLDTGDILLKHSVIVPANEQWLHTPAMQKKLAKADAWMSRNAAAGTPLSAIVRKKSVG